MFPEDYKVTFFGENLYRKSLWKFSYYGHSVNLLINPADHNEVYILRESETNYYNELSEIIKDP